MYFLPATFKLLYLLYLSQHSWLFCFTLCQWNDTHHIFRLLYQTLFLKPVKLKLCQVNTLQMIHLMWEYMLYIWNSVFTTSEKRVPKWKTSFWIFARPRFFLRKLKFDCSHSTASFLIFDGCKHGIVFTIWKSISTTDLCHNMLARNDINCWSFYIDHTVLCSFKVITFSQAKLSSGYI